MNGPLLLRVYKFYRTILVLNEQSCFCYCTALKKNWQNIIWKLQCPTSGKIWEKNPGLCLYDVVAKLLCIFRRKFSKRDLEKTEPHQSKYPRFWVILHKANVFYFETSFCGICSRVFIKNGSVQYTWFHFRFRFKVKTFILCLGATLPFQSQSHFHSQRPTWMVLTSQRQTWMN